MHFQVIYPNRVEPNALSCVETRKAPPAPCAKSASSFPLFAPSSSFFVPSIYSISTFVIFAAAMVPLYQSSPHILVFTRQTISFRSPVPVKK